MKLFLIFQKKTDLEVSQHEICECYVSDDVNCTAVDGRSPFLTCDRLLSDKVLVVIMWVIGLNALWGNVFVLSQKRNKSDKNKVQNFLLRNLAMSDLLMGVSVAYPGGCIACACTPGGLRGAPKRRGEKERSKERERKKGKKRGAKEGEKGRERKYAKEKEKREEIKRK